MYSYGYVPGYSNVQVFLEERYDKKEEYTDDCAN